MGYGRIKQPSQTLLCMCSLSRLLHSGLPEVSHFTATHQCMCPAVGILACKLHGCSSQAVVIRGSDYKADRMLGNVCAAPTKIPNIPTIVKSELRIKWLTRPTFTRTSNMPCIMLANMCFLTYPKASPLLLALEKKKAEEQRIQVLCRCGNRSKKASRLASASQIYAATCASLLWIRSLDDTASAAVFIPWILSAK